MKLLTEYCKQISINEYLSTKSIKTPEQIDFETFCKCLYLKQQSDQAKRLFNIFKNDCDRVIGDNLEEDQRIATDFELIFMLAAMLNCDGQEPQRIYNIGLKNYKGMENPYNYSWFEEENSNGKDVLEIMQDLYSSDKRFREMFDEVYYDISNGCENCGKAIDGVWDLQHFLDY